MLLKYLGKFQYLSIAALMLIANPIKADWFALNMTRGITDISNEVFELHMLIFWICVAIGVVVFAVMFYSMYAHTKKKNPVAATFHENTKVEIAWTIIPFLILIAMAIPASKTLVKIYDDEAGDVNIQVTGYQWKWQYNYLEDDISFFANLSTDADEIYNLVPKGENYLQEVDEMVLIPVGKKVRFLITANDVIHSWWVPDFGVKRDAITGFVNDAAATVTKPGVYRGQCTELCGKGHAFMPIVVNVLEKEEYKTWLAEKKVEQAAIRELTNKTFTMDELMEKGEVAYNRSCAGCHQVNGQGIPGIFPSLVGQGIAVGPVEAHIDIIVNGQAGTAMQAFGDQLSELDQAAIITYERNAWGNDVGDITQPIDVYNWKKGK